jgi:hypothetical protein
MAGDDTDDAAAVSPVLRPDQAGRRRVLGERERGGRGAARDGQCADAAAGLEERGPAVGSGGDRAVREGGGDGAGFEGEGVWRERDEDAGGEREEARAKDIVTMAIFRSGQRAVMASGKNPSGGRERFLTAGFGERERIPNVVPVSS